MLIAVVGICSIKGVVSWPGAFFKSLYMPIDSRVPICVLYKKH